MASPIKSEPKKSGKKELPLPSSQELQQMSEDSFFIFLGEYEEQHGELKGLLDQKDYASFDDFRNAAINELSSGKEPTDEEHDALEAMSQPGVPSIRTFTNMSKEELVTYLSEALPDPDDNEAFEEAEPLVLVFDSLMQNNYTEELLNTSKFEVIHQLHGVTLLGSITDPYVMPSYEELESLLEGKENLDPKVRAHLIRVARDYHVAFGADTDSDLLREVYEQEETDPIDDTTLVEILASELYAVIEPEAWVEDAVEKTTQPETEEAQADDASVANAPDVSEDVSETKVELEAGAEPVEVVEPEDIHSGVEVTVAAEGQEGGAEDMGGSGETVVDPVAEVEGLEDEETPEDDFNEDETLQPALATLSVSHVLGLSYEVLHGMVVEHLEVSETLSPLVLEDYTEENVDEFRHDVCTLLFNLDTSSMIKVNSNGLYPHQQKFVDDLQEMEDSAVLVDPGVLSEEVTSEEVDVDDGGEEIDPELFGKFELSEARKSALIKRVAKMPFKERARLYAILQKSWGPTEEIAESNVIVAELIERAKQSKTLHSRNESALGTLTHYHKLVSQVSKMLNSSMSDAPLNSLKIDGIKQHVFELNTNLTVLSTAIRDMADLLGLHTPDQDNPDLPIDIGGLVKTLAVVGYGAKTWASTYEAGLRVQVELEAQIDSLTYKVERYETAERERALAEQERQTKEQRNTLAQGNAFYVMVPSGLFLTSVRDIDGELILTPLGLDVTTDREQALEFDDIDNARALLDAVVRWHKRSRKVRVLFKRHGVHVDGLSIVQSTLRKVEG